MNCKFLALSLILATSFTAMNAQEKNNNIYIGAGIGEYVLVAQGSAARIGCGMTEAQIDAAIVGIVDDIGRLG